MYAYLTFVSYFMIMAAPVHQMQQYYRLGSLDNCSGKWNALVDCLKLKTKRSQEAEVIISTTININIVYLRNRFYLKQITLKLCNLIICLFKIFIGGHAGRKSQSK